MANNKKLQPFRTGSMHYDGDHFFILDQTLLPDSQKWLLCDSIEALVDIIQRLAIRGAPAIGISSSILLGLEAQKGKSRNQIIKAAEILSHARPTAVNLRNNIDRVLKNIHLADYPNFIITEAEKILAEDIELCERMARLGASVIGSDENILTHCNTGGLATAGIGTAFGVILKAHHQGKNPFVWIDETRPLLQGARLTAWECIQNSMPHRIICDNAAGKLMHDKVIHRIFVGSDRIAVNGDFANKIGTYSLAVLAKHHGVPFYVVAPHTTIDPTCKSGRFIPIEERGESEIKGVKNSSCDCSWSPEESKVYNPAFDVTPAEFVTAWILDTGIYTLNDIHNEEWWK